MSAEITLYTTSWCPFCNRAKQLLQNKGATYTDIDVEQVQGAREQMQQRSGRTSVPQIWIGKQHIGGCDELHALEAQGELDALLNK